jgi:O-antigen/teichoic acid export membrane protein
MISSIILIPIYLKFIPIETYGAWLATGNILVWITALDPGLSAVLQQQIAVAYGKKDFQAISEIIIGSLLLTASIVCLIMGFGYIAGEYLPRMLNITSMVDIDIIMEAFFLAVIGTGLMIISYSVISINKGFLSSVGVGNIGLIMTVLSLFLTVALLYNDFGLIAIPLSLIFRGTGFIIGNIGYLIWRLSRESIPIYFSFNGVRKLTLLMSYTFLGKMGGVIANNMDLFVVSRYFGPESVAMLSLTRKGPDISRTFVERPPVAFMPAVSHLVGAGEIEKAKILLVRLIRILLWILAPIVGSFIFLNDDFVGLWVGQALFAGMNINIIICVSVLLAMVTNSLANLCFALGNIRGNSIVAFIQSSLTAILVIVGAKYYGIVGVVLSPVISMAIISLWYFPSTFSRLLKMTHIEKMNIAKEILRILTISFPLTIIYSMLNISGWFQFIVIVLAYVSSYALGLYFISGELKIEVKGVIRLIDSKCKRRESNQ